MGVDVTSLLQGIDLRDLAGRYTALRRASVSESAGPCPKCKGHDRFHCTATWFFCRQCHEKRGDALDFVRWLEGLDFKGAVSFLGGTLPERKPIARPAQPQHKPYPNSDWQERAWRVIAHCERFLWSDGEWPSKARAYLAERGIGEAAALAFRLGYTLGGELHGHHLERGIVIPWWRGDSIWKLNIRRPAGAPKYRAVAGSVEGGLFGAHYLGRSDALLVTEGELDCVLAYQEAGDLVDVTTAGSSTATLRPEWLPVLSGYRRVLVCTDNDGPGHEAAKRWLALLPPGGSERVLPPGGVKDITDAILADAGTGSDLRDWVTEHLWGTALEANR